MDGIDRDRINEILLRESGNSTFMQRQRKMDDNTNRKIDEMKQRLEEIDNTSTNKNWRSILERDTIDPLIQRYREQRRPLSTCVVMDLDSFFISCHILDNPRLAGIPACVGSSSMISTSNYVARQYGVRAAMPGYLGSKLVSELSGGKETLTFVKSDFELYKKKSMDVKAVLEEYDPNLSMFSLDEAYMDIGPYLEIQLLDETKDLTHDTIFNMLSSANESRPRASDHLHEKLSKDIIHDAAKFLLRSIREKIRSVTGLTCSAGLSSNFMLAKIASDINKPNGQYFVGPSEQEILEFVHPLPLRKVNGIGRVMEKTLRGVSGIETVKDLYTRRADIHALFKPATAHFLLRASIGHSESKLHESAEDENDENDENLHRKGISHEFTFSPTSSWSELCINLEKISLSLVQDLRERNLRPKTITLKVKLANFDILTKATTRDVALFQSCNNSRSPRDLVDIAVRLLKEVKREHDIRSPTKKGQSSNSTRTPFAIRLLGVRCSNFLLNEDNQQSLHQYQISYNLIHADYQPNYYQNKDNNSPIVKNPYVRPKICASSNEKLHSAKGVTCEKPDATELENRVQCPLCNRYFESDENGNTVLNAHIDACLNASAVKQFSKEETLCADERMRKKRCKLTDFFGSATSELNS